MSSNRLERYVRDIAKMLHDEQCCRLYKHPNDIKIVGKELIHAEQGPADFWGYTRDGRVMLLECKMTARPRLDFSPKGLKPHQRRALLEVHKAGGVGLLLWQYETEIAVLDHDQISRYAAGRKSISWHRIDKKYRRPLVSDPRRFFWPHLDFTRRSTVERPSPTQQSAQ